MIAGTFALEDQFIQFHELSSRRVEYTVVDALTGVAATKVVGKAEFCAATYMALFGEDNADERMYELARDAMLIAFNVHTSEDVEATPEELEEAVLLLRWIP